MAALLKLLDNAKRERDAHRAAGRPIDAAASSIRVRALQDALDAIREDQST